MNARPHSTFSRSATALVVLTVLAALAVAVSGQNQASALTVLAREGRRTIPLTVSGDQEFVALDDLAGQFQLAVREESGAITVSHRGRTIVLTPNQPLVSVAGRLVSLSAAPVRTANRWTVPVEFISRALAPIYETRLELRRPSHLLIVGDLRVPRVAIRHEVLGNAARVTIDATPRAGSTVSQDGNQRLSVKFDVDALDVTYPAFQSQGFVQAFRDVDPTTIGIELGPRFATFRATSQTIDDTARVVVDLIGPSDATPTPAPVPTQTGAAPPELPVFGGPAPAFRTLAIDAGHGGDDTGARGAGGLEEKAVALSLARRLKAAVEGRVGLRVVMTREDDRGLPITDRTALANNNKADLFVSLHANGSFRNTLSGAAVYVASFDQESSAAGGGGRGERLPAFGGGFRDLELVPWSLAQMRHRDRSLQLATLVAERLKDRVPLAPRPVDTAPLRVLESANMPAVLIEVGYLSNADQEKQLANGEFQNTIVQSIVDSIVAFRDAGAPPPGGAR